MNLAIPATWPWWFWLIVVFVLARIEFGLGNFLESIYLIRDASKKQSEEFDKLKEAITKEICVNTDRIITELSIMEQEMKRVDPPKAPPSEMVYKR